MIIKSNSDLRVEFRRSLGCDDDAEAVQEKEINLTAELESDREAVRLLASALMLMCRITQRVSMTLIII